MRRLFVAEAFMRAVFLGLLLVSPCLPAFADDAPKPASGPEPTSVVVSVKAGDSWDYEFRDGITNDLISTVHMTVTQVAEGEIDVRNTVTKVKTKDENSTLERTPINRYHIRRPRSNL